MPDITIPEAALEAAYHKWRRIDPIIGTGDVRLIVAAAAPYIAAQALRDAAEAFYGPGGPRGEVGPAVWLKRRADQIEAGNG